MTRPTPADSLGQPQRSTLNERWEPIPGRPGYYEYIGPLPALPRPSEWIARIMRCPLKPDERDPRYMVPDDFDPRFGSYHCERCEDAGCPECCEMTPITLEDLEEWGKAEHMERLADIAAAKADLITFEEMRKRARGRAAQAGLSLNQAERAHKIGKLALRANDEGADSLLRS